MQTPSYKELLDAGCHFGHLKKKWNPKMAPNIFMERKGIHIIDLNRTAESLERAGKAMKQVAKSGKKVLFVATKKQGREIVVNAAKSVNMPFVTERWLGGMMTNFETIRKSIKKMQHLEKQLGDANTVINKKERLMKERERVKLERVLGGIAQLNRPPAVVFLVDIGHEHLALDEAKRLGMKTFGMVDTNCDPNTVDFAIPANDDASKSIAVIVNYITGCIKEGLADRHTAQAAVEVPTVEAAAE